MSRLSPVLDRLSRWVDAEDEGTHLASFRRAFVAIWLVYDGFDLVFGATERSLDWYPHPRDPGLVVVQVVLLLAGAMRLAGRAVWIAGMTAATARAAEAF